MKKHTNLPPTEGVVAPLGDTLSEMETPSPHLDAHFDSGVVTQLASPKRSSPLVAASSPHTVNPDQHTLQVPVLTPIDMSAAGPDARLLQLGALGAGGMGEVLCVHDRTLNRSLAMKVLHTHLLDKPHLRDRFLKEAQITAQLSHPGVPPVHELGAVEGVRFFFTMKQVHGRTLADLIAAHHSVSEQRRLEIFQKVCETVAYAHARGVIHCDLKPQNIMVGAFGEVLVMDWGLARLVAPAGDLDAIEPPVQIVGVNEHDPNAAAGTPAYMPPEQALGDLSLLSPATDVYALGLILYELFTGCHLDLGPPLQRVMSEAALPQIPKRAGSVVDDALNAILVRALHPTPAGRYPHASALTADITRWREGALRREKALALTQDAERILPAAQAARDSAQRLRYQAAEALASFGPLATVEQRAQAWALEDRAVHLAHHAARQTAEAVQHLQGALAHCADLPEALALLSHIHFERHLDAEHRRAWDEAELHEAALRAHDRGAHADYLAGTATLSLATEPPCRVSIHRYVSQARVLKPVLWLELDNTPLRHLNLPVGSYLLTLHHPSQAASVQYPVSVCRQYGWDCLRPQQAAEAPVPLAPALNLDPSTLYIPGGWAWIGGDPPSPIERMWVDGFFIQAHPVTAKDFAAFLASPQGAPWRQEALRDGLSLWNPRWPAVGMSWEAANAYAAWFAERTQTPWRLPSEVEWEKAARGVDARVYPWGDFADPSFCRVRDPAALPQTPSAIDAFPTDCSPYGLRGAGGNVRDWCAPKQGPSPDAPKPVRGGSWRLSVESARVAAHATLPPRQGFPDVGFRLARSLAT